VAEELIKNAHRGDTPTSSSRAPLELHRKLPGYTPTPLVESPALADRLGVGRVLVKVESSRLGLPAFKMLGASWGTYRALVERLAAVGVPTPEWSTIDDLRVALDPLRPLRLAAATDGNHGRAVARMAKLLGFAATILVPDDMAAARIDAIRGEGADVEIVSGTYDDAVARSAALQSDRCVVVSDTSWPGYEDTPRHVIEGYATIFAEIDDTLGTDPRIDVVFLPAGVGALAAAGIAAYAARVPRPTLVSVEPADAACVLESIRAGKMTAVPGPHRSIMVGLNCGNASLIAFPVLLAGLDWCVAIGDGRAESGMRLLDGEGIVAGETGAASLAGALGVIELGGRDLVGLTPDATVLLIVTEGATDPVRYEQIVGHPPR
jgi:diaminopropionate ammonia-lyase